MKSALEYLTGVDSVARELAKATSWRDEIKHSLEPNLVSQYLDQQISSLSASASTTASEYLATATVANFFEKQQRLVCDAVRPLARLREESIWEHERAKLLASAQSSIALQSYAHTIAGAQLSALESTRKAFNDINVTASSVFNSMDAERWSTIESASRPYSSLIDSFMHESTSVKALMGMVDGSSWITKLKLPVIDAASAAAVAKTWGIDGALREIGAMGLDAKTLQAFAATFDRDGDIGQWAGDDVDFAGGVQSYRKTHGLSLEMWFSILGVLLAILVPIWQKMDSDATEARLTAGIGGIALNLQDHETKSAERIEALTLIVNKMIEQSAPKYIGDVDFVVRSRVALIRRAGKSGSHVVAEVFPNQVVKLVSEDGKWIEVKYFDWIAQEQRLGWALKKYFLRVNVDESGEMLTDSDGIK